jgi:hypothetical protein
MIPFSLVDHSCPLYSRFVLLFVMRYDRDPALAGSAAAATSEAYAVVSAPPAAEVAAAQTAAFTAAGRGRLTSAITTNTSTAGSKVDGSNSVVPSSRNGASTARAVATSVNRPVKTVIRSLMIPRSDPAKPASSSFKLDVRCFLRILSPTKPALLGKTQRDLHISRAACTCTSM